MMMKKYTVEVEASDRVAVEVALSAHFEEYEIVRSVPVYTPQVGDVLVSTLGDTSWFRTSDEWVYTYGQVPGVSDEDVVEAVNDGSMKPVVRDGKVVDEADDE